CTKSSASGRQNGKRTYSVPRVRSTQKLPMRPADFLAMPRTNATATAMPAAAEMKLWNASWVICEKYDIVVSPTYDCQFVLVVNDADVSNDWRSLTAGRCCGLNGNTFWRRSTRYVSSIDAALNSSKPPA